MSNLLRGTELAERLHADHIQAMGFMVSVADEVEPIYEDWKNNHSWQEIPASDAAIIPSIWRSFTNTEISESAPSGVAQADLWGDYADACEKIGIDYDQLTELYYAGLWTAVHAPESADLYCEPEAHGYDRAQVHRTSESFMSGDAFTPVNGENRDVLLGDLTITNIGVGSREDYRRFHDARTRSARLVSEIFAPSLRVMAEKYDNHTEQLARALNVAKDSGNLLNNPGQYERPEYNPLMHTMLEGMMGVGQVTNYLVQSGVEGGETLLDDVKNVLSNRLPAVMSKLVINGHLGPNQMAGLAVRDALVRNNGELHVSPLLLKIWRDEKKAAAANVVSLEGEDLEVMQRLDVRAVNRCEGCPASRLVRLMSQMLLDAMSA